MNDTAKAVLRALEKGAAPCRLIRTDVSRFSGRSLTTSQVGRIADNLAEAGHVQVRYENPFSLKGIDSDRRIYTLTDKGRQLLSKAA